MRQRPKRNPRLLRSMAFASPLCSVLGELRDAMTREGTFDTLSVLALNRGWM